jgi:cytochrome c
MERSLTLIFGGLDYVSDDVRASRSQKQPDFRYSNPMKRANLVWDEENLRAYISDPQAKVKGSRMPYSGTSDPKDVDDVVAYLKTLK